MLKRLFLRNKNDQDSRQGAGWLIPQSGADLLNTPYRRQAIKHVWDLTSLTRPVFDEFLLKPLERFAELVQQLPASENHHHAYAGGMLDHALEVMNYALRIRRQHLLPPGAAPEEQSSAGERWTIAVAYAALLHDAAKMLVDVDIYLEGGHVWRLWEGKIPGPYRVQYRKGRDYQLHQVTNGLLCTPILEGKVLNWLYEDATVFSQLMYTIAGYENEAGVIGEIVAKADRASVASALGGDPAKALKAPVESLQRKLVDALRYLVKEQLALNIVRAPAYLTEEALWIVAPSVPHQIKAYLLQHGVSGVPSKTPRMYDEMQAHGLIMEASEGRSVWKGNVQIGEWQASLQFLKVPPGVVWGPGEERPPVLNGSLTVSGSSEEKRKKTVEQADATVIENSPVMPKSHTAELPAPQDGDGTSVSLGATSRNVQGEAAVEQGAEQPAHQQEITSNDMDVDEMIALISGNKNGKKLTEPVSNEEYNAPPLDKAPSDTGNASGKDKLDDYGERFLYWLETGLESNKIIVNHTKALVHVVEDTYFLVSPGIFKRFCALTFGSEKPWNKVQQRFQNLGLHQKPTDDRNIVEALVRGPNRKGNVLKGYLLKPDCGLTPHLQNNVFLSLKADEAD